MGLGRSSLCSPPVNPQSRAPSWTQSQQGHLLEVLSGRRGLSTGIEAIAGIGAGISAGGTVPRVIAVGPRQLSSEGGKEIVQCPGDDDVIEEAHIERDEDDSEAHAWDSGQRVRCLPTALRARDGGSEGHKLSRLLMDQDHLGKPRTSMACRTCEQLGPPSEVHVYGPCHRETPGV